MANEVSIRITANDDTQAVRDKLKAAFATMGVEAAAAFRENASKGTKDAGSTAGAAASDAFSETTTAGFGAAATDAAKEFKDKATPAVKQGASDVGAAAADAVREPAVSGFGAAGEDAAKKFNEKARQGLSKGNAPTPGAPSSGAPIEPPIRPKTDEPASEEEGKKTTEAVSRGMSTRGQLIATAIVGAVIGGGPVIDAAGIGTGVLFLTAMAATIQHGNPALEAGWAKLKDDATTAATAASMGMVAPLDRAMGEIDGLIQGEGPLLKRMFDDAAADVPILTQAVVDFTTNALPGLESGLHNSQQVMSATAGMAAVLGKDVGEIGASFGHNSQEAVTGLNALSGILDQLGHTVATVVDFTTRLASGALPTLASGLGGVLGVANGVLHVLEPIAPALGSIAIYGVEAWGSFKLASAASTGMESLGKSLAKLSTDLTSYSTKTKETEFGSTRIGTAMTTAATAGAGFATKVSKVANEIGGPLGIALGVGSMAMMLFGSSSEDAAQKAQQQAEMTKSLAQALEQSHGVVDANVQSTMAQSLATNDAASTLTKYGVSMASISQIALRGKDAIEQQVSTLEAQKDALTGSSAAAVAAAGRFGHADGQTQQQTSHLDEQIQAWRDLEATMPDAVKQQQAYEAAVNASAAAMGVNVGHLSAAQNSQEAFDSTLNAAVAQYMQNTSAIKQYNDAMVAAAGANLTAKDQFQQLDDAVTSAQQAVTSASIGVANAQHSLVDAGNAVDAARHSEQQAVQGVTEAQYSYQQALRQEKAAQEGVMAARQAAADQLESLQRQMADQGDSLASAKLRLEQAQAAVAKAGLSGVTLDSLGDPTSANEANYQLLLNLSQAQHALNDTQAQGADLAKQNAAAQKAGIEGNAGVISAEQQLASAKHSTAQAALGVQNATYAERQASLAVSDAIWAQHSAQVALTQAQQSGLDAQRKLTEAKDADSRTLDINTDAGNRNWKTVEDLFYKNLATTGSVQAATKVTEDETAAMGFNQGAVQGVIDTLGGIANHTFNFSVVGTPNLDLGPMQGILKDPNLGLFTNGKGASGGIASAGRLATGGPVTGPGGPRDDLVPLWASAGEYMQPADVVDHYGLGFMEALRQKKVPKYANGGQIAANDLGSIMALNAGVSTLAGIYEGVGSTGNALHAKPSLPTALSKPGNFSAGVFGNMSMGGSGSAGPMHSSPAASGTPLAAQQYAASRLGAFGWGQDQMSPLIALWNQESGWNPNAVNPSSGAYGIPQSLGHGHPYDLGDYVAQVNWGLDYIKGRYGSPGSAEAHERAFNWYGSGGPVTDGIAGIHDRGREIVRLPNGSTVVPNSNTETALGGAPSKLAVSVDFTGSTDQAFSQLFMKLVRDQKIQIKAQYVRP